ncbi:GGDEF domain-containing protein [Planctobacterium marinum]|uniref:GGDEF domain-containing protein n=1 Tax=Planctobacterium marinum TaxID=1631968 RepID=UPI001E3709C2|nr:GGDEF domain-containing protein [Planctobacterium marinum]MCC2606039.1 GGDEF domain-containing protein [Planctobacterium marinum]
MENLAPFYDNTITDRFFNIHAQQTHMSDKEKNQLLQVLTNSLDLQELGELVYTEVKARLNASFLNIVSPVGTFQFGEQDNQSVVRSFDLLSGRDGSIKIEYGFVRTLSLRENQLLKDINQCVKNPVRNALQFYQIQKLALKDGLTSLGNRRQFDETLEKATSKAHRDGDKVSLIMMDLDKFKQVNDQFGHHEGDKVLMSVAGAINQSLRNSDYAFRFGGDEFCCITTNTDETANNLIVERIQEAVANDSLLQKHGVSVSFGMAMLHAQDDETTLFDRADKALYQAKKSGRNCAKWAA